MIMKVLRLTAAFTLMLLAASSLSAQTQPSRSDVQNWNDVQLTVPVNKTVDFVLLGTLRVGRNLNRPVD
jgi:outer membrane biogenesis lipoprotein LolB